MIIQIMRLLKSAVIGMLLVSLFPIAAFAVDWPQEITEPEGKIVVYQLQPDSLSGNTLQGKAALSIELTGQSTPTFGAFWFIARVDTGSEVAQVRDVDVTQIKWPDSTPNTDKLNTIVDNALKSTTFQLSMKSLTASLASSKQERKSLEELKNTAPTIIFKQELTVLLTYDGAPIYRAIDNSQYERVINTPFAVARNKTTKKLYLSSGSFWYEADNPLGPWTLTRKPPAELVKLMPKPKTTSSTSGTPPAIYATTTPTELISTQGQPKWKSLIAGQLLYVTNTEVPWIRDTSNNKMYVLLSGRWYSAAKESGPWTFVRADKLPESFSNIPPDSDISGVRVSVAGTAEANEAVINAKIPQTAAITRKGTTTTVTYNGDPKFEMIPGTQVAYAVNTDSQVLRVDNKFYAVDNGVWFIASSPTGPWIVADHIPSEQIAQIPPSSPVYNTTYVQIYDSTPDVVYVGYTSGYLWSYPYYGVPVYGTGWYYPPLWGPYYYPRPVTWGVYVGYNPWIGWNYGMSWGYGFYSAGFAWGVAWGGGYYAGGYHGGGYRSPVFINNGNININTGNINIGNNINFGNKTNINNQIQKNNITRNNIYNNPQNRVRNADKSTLNKNFTQATHNPTRKNNVFSDRNGNVARDNNGQWQSRTNKQWQNVSNQHNMSQTQKNNLNNKAQNHTNGSGDFSNDFKQQMNNRGIDRDSLNNSRNIRQNFQGQGRFQRGRK
ncbi:carbohydrate-binding family V/XII [uncultured Shewanella sp.]|uniref:carbohydrate-binding family V/XII n=1 Tax=uncultured Shewanella sp. TaxID=173975 RepID=UPI0026084A3D|nr:carbohydrate-binding family V/XII [uncultured Shewanella sp.]